MAPHDPLFKRLLQLFFADFLRLTSPPLPEHVDLSALTFLDKEFPSGGPEARSRIVDLLVRVPLLLKTGKPLLVHIEIEARARAGMGERLQEYHRWICTRHEGQVLSVVIYLRGGQPGVREEVVSGPLAGPGLTAFRYLAVGLAGSTAGEYLAKPEPLAWALASLMDPVPWSRAELKMACLRRIATATLDETRRFELFNCVETYLQLRSEGEATEFAALGALPTNQETQTMAMTWADRKMAEGEKLGRKAGRAEGIREVLLLQLAQRFGTLSDEVRRRIEEIDSAARLTRLAQRVLTAQSLQEMGLG